jgi:hypothetical protein
MSRDEMQSILEHSCALETLAASQFEKKKVFLSINLLCTPYHDMNVI